MEAKGKVLLRVMGILMIIGGALSLLLSIVLMLAAAELISVGGPVPVIVGMILMLLGAAADLIAGIVCLKHAADKGHTVRCVIWSLIVIVLQTAGLIMTVSGIHSASPAAVTGGFTTASLVITVAAGVVIPVMAIIGACLNHKSGRTAGKTQDPASLSEDEETAEIKKSEEIKESMAETAGVQETQKASAET